MSSPLTITYTGHADSVRLATWMPRFEYDSSFVQEGHHWSLTLDLPEDARIEYRIEVERRGQVESILDPLNAEMSTNPFGRNSVLTGPAYEKPDWLSHDWQNPGNIAELRVTSEILGGRRSVRLYRPDGISDSESLPLLFVFDGSDFVEHAQLNHCLNVLIGTGRIPPIRAAFSDPRRRELEYTASEAHAACMLDEVLPYVERRVNVSSLMAVGASLGGVAAWNIATRRPERFSGTILMSGTFARSPHPELDGRMFTDIESFVDRSLAEPVAPSVAIHQSCGRYESLIDWNREVAGRLTENRPRYRFVETWTGHDWGAWRDQLGPGLELIAG